MLQTHAIRRPLFCHLSFVHAFYPIGVFLCLVSGSVGYAAEKAVAAAAKPVPVTAATVKRMDFPEEVQTFGQMTALESVSVQPRVTTMIKAVKVRDGQLVRAGDLLFELDDEPFRVAADKARATLERDTAQADNAAVEDRRQLALLEQKAISKDSYDLTHTAYLEAVATEEMSDADLRTAELQMGYCTIQSPLDGAIGRVAVKAGNMAQAYSNELVFINRLSPIRAAFIASETHLAAIRAAMAAGPVAVWALPGGDAAGKVEGALAFIDNKVDIATGTISMEAEFANTDLALWPGQYVRVVIRLGVEKGALVVPVQALHPAADGGYAVAVIGEDSAVDIRACTVTRRQGDLAVVAGGVKEGDRVVLDGYLRLTRGTKVEAAAPAEAESK